MPANLLGQRLTLQSWGESHGSAIGGVLDGLPPNMVLDIAAVQSALDKRKPGSSKFVTQRHEDDAIEFLSGLYEGKTTGHPLAFIIANKDARSKDYDAIAQKFRPAHADWSWQEKYGIRDPRGGGRSSARETAIRVAAGAVALQVLHHLLGPAVEVWGALVELGGDAADGQSADLYKPHESPFFCHDKQAVQRWEKALEAARKDNSSLGAIVEVRARGIPAGLGEPVYDRLDADLAKALISINAVKGVEIGAGFSAARLRGEENADEMRTSKSGVQFLSNNAGGILGGISTGAEIVARFALKPTSSLPRTLRSVQQDGKNAEVLTKGRHDPCVGIRAVPIGEAMMSLVLADHLLRHRGQVGNLGGALASVEEESP